MVVITSNVNRLSIKLKVSVWDSIRINSTKLLRKR